MKNVYPNHIVNSLESVYSLLVEDSPFRRKTEIMIRKFRRSILDLEIKMKIWKIKTLERDRTQVIEFLQRDYHMNIL